MQVLGATCGPWLGWFTLFISMFNLFGNGCAQIVAGAANSYSINPILDKRCCRHCVIYAHQAPCLHAFFTRGALLNAAIMQDHNIQSTLPQGTAASSPAEYLSERRYTMLATSVSQIHAQVWMKRLVMKLMMVCAQELDVRVGRAQPAGEHQSPRYAVFLGTWRSST